MSLLEQLTHLLGIQNIKQNEPMNQHTTFRVGGPASYFATPQTEDQIKQIINLFKGNKIPYYIIGNASNLIVKDKGFEGAIIQLGNNFSSYSVDGNIVTASAGLKLSKLAKILLDHNLKGLEFASGIPGTLGGAACMNAGAYGGEMKDVIKSVKALTPEGEVVELINEQLQPGYRTSIIAKKSYVVLEVTLEAEFGVPEEIKALMQDYNNRRREKQPLEYPSAGSTFKRPEGYFAGKLIQESGLRGYRVGGAVISEKHSGFVINTGDATTEDILTLIGDVKRIVHEKFGVTLQEEVKVI